MIQKATAMGNWRLAASSQQCSHSCITSCTEFFDETPTTQVTTLRLLPFPKTKITFEREEISDYRLDSGKYDRVAESDWENWLRSQGTYFEGDWGINCPMYNVSCIFFNKCLHFSYYMVGYLLDRPCISIFTLIYKILDGLKTENFSMIYVMDLFCLYDTTCVGVWDWDCAQSAKLGSL